MTTNAARTTNATNQTARRLKLSPQQIELCDLYFLQLHGRQSIARWLGIQPESVTRALSRAAERYPVLRRIRAQRRAANGRPFQIPFSQLNARDQAEVNAVPSR